MRTAHGQNAMCNIKINGGYHYGFIKHARRLDDIRRVIGFSVDKIWSQLNQDQAASPYRDPAAHQEDDSQRFFSERRSVLLGALTQHTSQKPVAQQIAEVDQADGEKIIGHILGKDQKELVNALAAQTGVSPEDTAKILASIAPSMLSGLSAATTTASNASNQKDDGFDLSDLAGLFGGQKPAANKPSTGFGGLANLLGGGQQQQQSSSLLGSLLGGGQQQQQQSGSLLGSLLGGSNNASSTSGNALLSSLMSMMKE